MDYDETPPELPPRPASMMASAMAGEWASRKNSIVELRNRRATLKQQKLESAEPSPPPPLPPRDCLSQVVQTSTALVPMKDKGKSKLADCKDQVERLSCWIDCTRDQAAELLQRAGLPTGTYLLRPCHSRQESFAISILRDPNASRSSGARRASFKALLSRLRGSGPQGAGVSNVKHYLIKESSDGYYLYSNRRFPDIVDLVAYYATMPAKRQSQALLRRSFAAAAAERFGDEADSMPEFAVDSQGRRVRLLHKFGQGAYEMYMAEVNGSQVVSMILSEGEQDGSFRSKPEMETRGREKQQQQWDKSNPKSQLALEYDRTSAANGGAQLNNPSRARSVIVGGALYLQTVIGRAVDRMSLKA